MITCFPYQRPEWASLEAIKEVNVQATFPEVVCNVHVVTTTHPPESPSTLRLPRALFCPFSPVFRMEYFFFFFT